MCDVKTQPFTMSNMPEFEDTYSLTLDVLPRKDTFISFRPYY